MKHLIISVLFTVLFAHVANAQITMGSLSLPSASAENAVVIDDVQFVAQYEMSFIQDTLNAENVSEETMMLKMGKKTSMFYSYTHFVADSLLRVQMRNSEGRVMQRREPGSKSGGQITYKIFKNYPDGKVTTLERIGLSRFLCEEENERPQWQLLPDTATILSYLCRKATCNFKGREYAAWYAPEIPRSEGPWKLHGLPGLILKAEDSRGHYAFECTGLFNGQPDEKIEFGADNYEPVSRRTLNRTYERYVADPVGFITSSSPNVRIIIKSEDGQDAKNPKNIPYNPIELAE